MGVCRLYCRDIHGVRTHIQFVIGSNFLALSSSGPSQGIRQKSQMIGKPSICLCTLLWLPSICLAAGSILDNLLRLLVGAPGPESLEFYFLWAHPDKSLKIV